MTTRPSSGAFRRSPLLIAPTTHHRSDSPSREEILSRTSLLEEKRGADHYSIRIYFTLLLITYHSSMVRYVILHKILREVPPYTSFRPNRLSAWLFAKGGHIHSVQTPDPATWSTPTTEFPDIFSLLSYPDANVSTPDSLPADEGILMDSWSDDEPQHHSESAPSTR